MKHLSNFSDLSQFGINPLTGEACAYSMRLLCDLSSAGCALVADFLSLRFSPDNPAACFNTNWNSQVNGRPAIASVMLSRSAFPDLCRFALFHDGCAYVIEAPDGSFIGLQESDEYCSSHVDFARSSENQDRGYRVWENHSKTGSRNIHAFTGRTV